MRPFLVLNDWTWVEPPSTDEAEQMGAGQRGPGCPAAEAVDVEPTAGADRDCQGHGRGGGHVEPNLATLLVLAADTGARWGELCAPVQQRTLPRWSPGSRDWRANSRCQPSGRPPTHRRRLRRRPARDRPALVRGPRVLRQHRRESPNERKARGLGAPDRDSEGPRRAAAHRSWAASSPCCSSGGSWPSGSSRWSRAPV